MSPTNLVLCACGVIVYSAHELLTVLEPRSTQNSMYSSSGAVLPQTPFGGIDARQRIALQYTDILNVHGSSPRRICSVKYLLHQHEPLTERASLAFLRDTMPDSSSPKALRHSNQCNKCSSANSERKPRVCTWPGERAIASAR